MHYTTVTAASFIEEGIKEVQGKKIKNGSYSSFALVIFISLLFCLHVVVEDKVSIVS